MVLEGLFENAELKHEKGFLLNGPYTVTSGL